MKLFNTGRRLEEKRKMITFLGLLLLAGFIITSLISYTISRDAIRQSIVNSELPLASDNIYSEIRRDLLQPIFISSLMANDTFLQSWILEGEEDVTEVKNYLSAINKRYDTISTFFVSAKTNRYYYPGGILKKVSENEPRDRWYFRVKKMEPEYEINVDPDMANKDTMTIFINYKIFDSTGSFIGATGVGVAMSVVKDLIANYRSKYNRNIFFFDQSGTIVLQSSDQEQASGQKLKIEEIPGLERFSTQILKGDLNNFEYRHHEEARLLNVRVIPELDWYLVVQQVKDNTSAILRQSLLLNLSVCLVISIIVLGIIRITIIRYQDRLEDHNQALVEKNKKINEQKLQLKDQKLRLEEVNKELEFLNSEKNEFIGITAHDLKSPLNAVVGFSEIIYTSDDIDKTTREIAEHIYNSSLNMVERINNLLDIREAETGFNVKLESFDFKIPIDKTIQDFKYQAQAKDISIQLNGPDKEVWTLANEKWMVEILGNLVSNAIKYSPRSKSIWLNLVESENKVRFEVVDEGPGIPKEDMPKLFQKYTRATPEPTGGESSTGLGLYIVRKMAERMGGKAWCESEQGRGSEFFVEFPVAPNKGR